MALVNSVTRILLVEDEHRIAEVVQHYLEREGFMVTWVADGEHALSELQRRAMDLVVLDLMLPGIQGEEVCRRIRETSDVPVIMLTARDGEEDLLHGLGIGADDYITKPFSPRELVARVRVLLRRTGGPTQPKADVLERAGGRLVIDAARRRVWLDGRNIELTEFEFRLLAALARFPGRVYTRVELLDKVQGCDFEAYERTIDAHVKNLRHKLGEDGRRSSLIETVFGRGYRLREDPREPVPAVDAREAP
jgi:two-component system, OmpR family, response regulator RegX3